MKPLKNLPKKSLVKKDTLEVKYKWLPVVNAEKCDGCGKCVEACGPRCLAIINQLAVLTEAERCGSEEHCIEPCPQKAIRMEWLPWEGDEARGKWQAPNLLAQIISKKEIGYEISN